MVRILNVLIVLVLLMIDIVIRTLNECENLKILFPRLIRQTVRPNKIIFVDSGSTDGTLEYINKLINQNENLIKLHHIKKKDFTFGKSLNLGFENSNAEFIISLSAHCFPKDESWLEQLINKFIDNDVMMVSGAQTNYKLTRLSEASVQMKWFPQNSSYLEKENNSLNNGNAAYRKSIWEKYKFDENLTGLEDMFIARQILQDNKKIYYSHSAVVEHYHVESYPSIRNRFKRECIALKHMYPEIKFNFYEGLTGFIKGVFFDLKLKSKVSLPSSDIISITRYRFNQFYGMYLGLKTTDTSQNLILENYYYPPSK